jgi:hypothetical protein
MAINRRFAKNFVVVLAILAVTGTFLLLIAWVNSLPPPIGGPMRTTNISITGVHFGDNYLNITVKNLYTRTKIINEVTVRDLITIDNGFIINQTSTPYTVPVYEPVLVGEEISFRVSFNWTSGYPYQIELETADSRDCSPATNLNAVAP